MLTRKSPVKSLVKPWLIVVDSLNINMATSSECWVFEEVPVPVPLATNPLPKLGSYLPVIEQAGPDRGGHHLQAGQVLPQGLDGEGVHKVNRLGRLLGNMFPWNRK